MKKNSLIFCLFFHLSNQFFSQTDSNNGNWQERVVFKKNTPEADYMIRVGDIDNLGFGWANQFNPFTGKSTDAHMYPWERDTSEILGCDMILLPSSMGKKNAPCSGDGYSGSFESLMQHFGKTTFPFQISLQGIDTAKINSVTMQLFVDDFQAKSFCTKYEVYLNSKRAPFAEKVLNALDQTGPIGKLITIVVPKDRISDFKTTTIDLLIDDKTTGAADGYAIDFIKILINPKILKYGVVSGKLINELTGKPIANANITCGNQLVKTNSLGQYKLTQVVPGLALISVEIKGKTEQNFTIDVEENSAIVKDLFVK